MKRFYIPPRLKAGETLVETLTALLIAALSAMFLTTMILAAANINHSAILANTALSDGITAAETQTISGGNGTLTITGEFKTATANISYYKSDNSPITSYQKAD